MIRWMCGFMLKQRKKNTELGLDQRLFLQSFDAAGWATGRATSLYKTSASKPPGDTVMVGNASG